MGEFKNSIRLGIELDAKSDVEGRLNGIIESLNNRKIELDLSIKDSNVANQLNQLTNMVNKFKADLGSNISLGDIDKVLNGATASVGNLNQQLKNVNFDQLQSKIIEDFATSAGIAGKNFDAKFKQSIKDNWNSGDIDKILSDSMNLSQKNIDTTNKNMSQSLKKELMEQYQGLFNGNALTLNAKGTELIPSGMKISLRNIEFDKTELETLSKNFGNYFKIDNINGNPIDRLLDEWTKKAQAFGFTLEGTVQDKLLKVSQLVNEYRDIKSNGVSTGLSNADEVGTLSKTENAYYSLIASLEKLEKEKVEYNAISNENKINAENEALEKQKSILSGLSGELQKQSTTNYLDGTKKVISSTSEGIGQIRKDLEILDKNGVNTAEIAPTVTTNYVAVKKAINDIATAKEALDKLMANGIIDKNVITDLQASLNPKFISSDSELNNLLNRVKELSKEEMDSIKLAEQMANGAEKTASARIASEQKIQAELENTKKKQEEVSTLNLGSQEQNRLKAEQDLINQMANGREKSEQKIREEIKKTEQVQADAINKNIELQAKENNSSNSTIQKEVYANLIDLQKEEYSIKQKLIVAEGEYKAKLEESLITNKLLQTEMNKSVQNSNLSSEEKEIELTNQRIKLQEQLNVAKAKNTDKVNSDNAAKLQQEEELLKKQEEAYQRINVLKSNGIISESEIGKLEQLTKSVASMQQMNGALSSIGKSESRESSISSLTKQIGDAQIKLEQMRQTFGSKLPNGFIESTEAELNKLLIDLKNVEGTKFTGIRDGLNGINSNMRETTNEAKQLVTALKETNGGFFSGISNFLATAGIFYGVAQAVQEVTQQLKNAYDYSAYLDQAFTDINITMDITKEQFVDMTARIQEMGVANGASSKTIMDIARVYSNASTDLDTVMEKIKPDLWLANVSRMDGGQVTKTIQSVTNQFKLMTKEGMTAEQATEKIGNTLVTVSKNMQYDFVDGVKELTESVKTSGSVAEMAGQSMDSYLSMAGAFIEQTGKTGSEFGNAYKMIASRVLQQGSLAEAVGTTNEEMAKAEKLMSQYGITIKDGNGGLKSLDAILLEVSKKWELMNDGERQFAASTLAGVRQSSSFVAMMESMGKQQNIYNKTQTDTTALFDAQKKYAESLEGRLGSLHATYESLLGKMMNSETLKWMVSGFTELLNVIGNLDKASLTYIATIGSLLLVMTKLSALNKELIAVQAGTAVATGFTKLIGVLLGMDTVMKTVTLSTGAMTVGLKGAEGAWLMLSTGIKEATASALAFIATPIGLIMTAIATAIGIAVAGFVAYEEHQRELTKQSKDLKEALEAVNVALKGGDTKTANEKADTVKQQQKSLEDLIATRQRLEGMSEDQFYSKMGGADKAQSIALVTYKINEMIGAIEKGGATVDETTGKINELTQAEEAIANTELANKIKEKTQAQLENRTGLEDARAEYENFIKTSQDLYAEYQNLSAQENLSAEQKAQLGSVVDQLQMKFTDLSVSVDENGVAHINNVPLITETISYLSSEGMTVETLTSIRMADSKACSEWSINNQNMTYAEVCNNIENYKTEIEALGKLAEARDANAKNPDFIGPIQDTDYSAQIKEAQDAEKGLESAKSRIDAIYGSVKAPVNYASSGASRTGVDAQPKASKGSTGKSDAEKEAEKAAKLAEEIAKMTSDIKTDRYVDVNNAVTEINNSLTENKRLQDATTGAEHYKALQQEIELYNQKKVALANLNVEQRKDAEEKRKDLEQYSFQFDAQGRLINSQQRLLEIQKTVNAMGGNTEAEKEKKKEYIDWVKDLQTETKEYADLVESKIPKITQEWNALGDSINKTNETMLKTVREEIVEGLKQELEEKKQKALEKDEEKKKKELDKIDAEIAKEKKKLADLDNDSIDKARKLAKLKAEQAKWEQDDSPLAKKKIQELNEQIKALEKDIQKDEINGRITDLETKKDETTTYYDKIKKKTEDSYDKQLKDKKLYEKADKMLTEKSMDEMIDLLTKYSDKYKDIGHLLGKNMGDAIRAEVEGAVKALGGLKDNVDVGDSYADDKVQPQTPRTADGANTDPNYHKEVEVGDTVRVEHSGSPVFTDGRGTEVTGSSWDENGVTSIDKMYVVGYDNGLFQLSHDRSKSGAIGWIPRDQLAQYDTGGKTPSNMSSSGALSILHPNEKILSADMTTRFEAIEDMAMAVRPMLSVLSNMDSVLKASREINNTSNTTDASNVDIKNTYNVTNNTPFDTKMFGKNVESQVKTELRRFGRIR